VGQGATGIASGTGGNGIICYYQVFPDLSASAGLPVAIHAQAAFCREID
jgi:hypothetical protein